MTREYWFKKKKKRENLLYRVYVCEESASLAWSGQASNL